MVRVQGSGKLKLIFHLREPVVSDEGIDIIVIPGVSTPITPEQQRKQACSWLKPLVAATTNDTRVYFFSYDLQADSSLLWRQLLDQGAAFNDALDVIRPDSQTRRRPLLFICHSLGGVVLKQALWISHQIPRNDTPLEDVTAGIIFLGTPHTSSQDDKQWEKWRWILKTNRKDIPKNSQSDDDIKSLSELCKNFERLNLQIPVLSVFEKKPTKVRDNLLQVMRGGSVKLVLVDEALCRTQLKYEQTFGAASDHNNLCIIEVEGQFYNRLVRFMKSIADEAPGNLALKFEELSFNDGSSTRSNSALATPVTTDPAPSSTEPAEGSAEGQPRAPEPITEQTQFDTTTPLSSASLPIFMTAGRSRNLDFYGRDDVLAQIDEVFSKNTEPNTARPPGSELRSVVICGMGGLGKTEVATEYVHSRRTKFDAIFWLNADTAEKLNYGFMEMAISLGLEKDASTSDEVATREVVKGWLSKPSGVTKEGQRKGDEDISWLIVFDNVNNPDILYDFWPETGPGSIIVTSRNPLAKDGIHLPTIAFDLQPFSLDEAAPFLRSISQREFEDNSLESCTTIAKLLGGLPLAITQMGGIIRRRHLSLDDFLEYFAEDARKLFGMRVIETDYKQTVASVWMLDVLTPSATALLQVLSFLDPDRIPEKLLLTDGRNIPLKDYPKKRTAYFDARLELMESSLVTRDIKSNELRIHRLVQDVVRSRMTEETTKDAFETVITLLSRAWPFTKFDQRNLTSRMAQCEPLFPHVEKLRSLFEEQIREGDFQASSSAASLFNEVSWYMVEKARAVLIGTYALLAQVILERCLQEPPDNEDELKKLLSDSYHYQTIAGCETDNGQGLVKCKAWIAMLVERIEKNNSKDDAYELADAYNQSGIAYMRAAQETEALQAWHQSIKAFETIPGSVKLDLTWPSIHLGIVYSIRGEGDEGDGFVMPMIEARAEAYGKDDTTSMVTGKLLHTAGDVRRSQGQLDEAMDFFERALSICRATIGNNHYITADACYRLAEQYIRVGKKEEAAILLDQSLKVYGDVKWFRPQAARSSFMKGRLLKSMGNDIEAQAQLDRAMRLRKELVPDDKRDADQLTDLDFDKITYYYSR